MKILLSCLILAFSFAQPLIINAESSSKKQLAIVIDDFGNNMKGTKEILDLPIRLTIAVMPFMSTTKEDATYAHKRGHEVIVHLPLEPKNGKKSWLGPGAITTDLSDHEIRKRTVNAIKNVPHAVGMNNHMGSKATEDERVMRIILEVCKDYGLFYLDSKTSDKSVISKVANDTGVPVLNNNYFFDDQYSIQHITRQAEFIAMRLLDTEQLIAIGHVGISGPKTFSVLEKYIPVFEERAEIIPLSKLLPESKFLDKKL